MSYKLFIALILTMIFAIFLSSCTTEFENPLPKQVMKIDKNLDGIWKRKNTQDKDEYFVVSHRPTGLIDVVGIYDFDCDDGPTIIRFEGYSIKIKSDNYLNLRVSENSLKDFSTIKHYLLLNYEFQDNNSIKIYFISPLKIKDAITSNLIKGTVNQEPLWEQILVTEDGNNILKLLRNKRASIFFDPNCNVTVKKID